MGEPPRASLKFKHYQTSLVFFQVDLWKRVEKLSSSQITCQFSLASYLDLAMTTAASTGRHYSSHDISVFYNLY